MCTCHWNVAQSCFSHFWKSLKRCWTSFRLLFLYVFSQKNLNFNFPPQGFPGELFHLFHTLFSFFHDRDITSVHIIQNKWIEDFLMPYSVCAQLEVVSNSLWPYGLTAACRYFIMECFGRMLKWVAVPPLGSSDPGIKHTFPASPALSRFFHDPPGKPRNLKILIHFRVTTCTSDAQSTSENIDCLFTYSTLLWEPVLDQS